MLCPNCGKQNIDGVKFCANCGAALQTVAPAAIPTPVRTPVPQMQVQNTNPVKKVPTAAKVLGWISMVLSCLGMIGMVLVFVAAAMPSGSGVLIDSEGGARLSVFFIGICLGGMLAPIGDVLGIISLINMLTKRNRKMIWLPITGIVLGTAAFIGSILGTVALGG